MELTIEAIVFVIFSVITLGAAVMVVSTRNLFHGALYLMLSLFGVAGLFVLLTAPFLAGVQVVLYIGAIAILIVFAIMLTPQVTRMTQVYNTQWVTALVVAALFFVMLLLVLTPLMRELGVDSFNAEFTTTQPPDVPENSISNLGMDLVDPDRFMLPFEVASILLMAALVGAALMVGPLKDSDGDAASPDSQASGG